MHRALLATHKTSPHKASHGPACKHPTAKRATARLHQVNISFIGQRTSAVCASKELHFPAEPVKVVSRASVYDHSQSTGHDWLLQREVASREENVFHYEWLCEGGVEICALSFSFKWYGATICEHECMVCINFCATHCNAKYYATLCVLRNMLLC